MRRRSLVVLISDFISQPGWERPLCRLTEQHEVVAVRLFDPREYELPDAGLLFVQDAESGEQLLVDSSDPELRRRLLDAGRSRDETIRHGVARARVRLHALSTEDDLLSALVRIAGSRRESTQMTFISPVMLLGLSADSCSSSRATRPRRGGADAAWPP